MNPGYLLIFSVTANPLNLAALMRARLPGRFLAATMLTSWLSVAIAAPQAAPEANAQTGEWLRKFPLDRDADIDHTTLRLRFEDLADRSFTAEETIRFHAVHPPLAAMSLDAGQLFINSIRLAGAVEEQRARSQGGATRVEWQVADGKMELEFDPPLGVGSHQLVINYSCIEPPRGMIFAPEAPGMPAQMHTQGESDQNHHWFVCHDFPNDRMSTEVIADVPRGVSVSSNGKLVSHTVAGSREVWHWLQEKPHVAYLVSIVAGEFSLVPLPNPISGVPMTVWVPPGSEAAALRTYCRTDAMIDVLSKAFGSPYPWARYDQLLVRDFGAGGMENTSATSMMGTALISESAIGERDFDGLISHELCHQWTGDLVTCESWEHIWLNEGWATYGTGLWFEARDGKSGYYDEVLGYFGVANGDTVDGPVPMVSNLYSDPGECFGRAANPYPKGASILHMLRVKLGDDAFFKGVRAYFARHALDTVETDDFRHCLEEASGKSLEMFFDQWCLRQGTPRLSVKHSVEQDGRMLKVSVDQTQRVDAATPAFQFTLPVEVTTKRGRTVHHLDVRDKSEEIEIPLDSPITTLSIDPGCAVLKTISTNLPTDWLLRNVADGSTHAARRIAARELGDRDDAQSREALAALVRDEGQRHSMRTEAAAALGRHASSESKALLLQLSQEALPDARVRRALIDALGASKPEGALAQVVQAASDRSPGVRESVAGALRALAPDIATHPEVVAALVEIMRSSTAGERAWGASLQSVGALKATGAIDAVVELTELGVFDRTRSSAVSALGELAAADAGVRERAIPILIELIGDGEWRVYTAAGEALATLGAGESLPALEEMSGSKNPRKREQARGWTSRIEEAVTAKAAPTP